MKFHRELKMSEIRLDAEIMIVGDGELIKNGSVVYKGSKIVYAGETEHAPNVENKKQVPVIMPCPHQT